MTISDWQTEIKGCICLQLRSLVRFGREVVGIAHMKAFTTFDGAQLFQML